MGLLIILALAAPLYAGDPVNIDPFKRLQPSSAEMWFGSDNLGRDVFARTIFGARISLVVGMLSAASAALAGLLIGVIAGYSRSFDNVVMRVMDGLMSIPTILLAIALISLTGPGIGILIVAIAIPETPAVARLVRSVVLGFASVPMWRRRSAAGRACPRCCGGISYRVPFLR